MTRTIVGDSCPKYSIGITFQAPRFASCPCHFTRNIHISRHPLTKRDSRRPPPPCESKKKHPQYLAKPTQIPYKTGNTWILPRGKTKIKLPKQITPEKQTLPTKQTRRNRPPPQKKKKKKQKNRNSQQAKTPVTQKIVRCFLPSCPVTKRSYEAIF